MSAMCHASEVDYALLGLYSLLAVCLLVQLARLVRYKLPSRVSLVQHSLLLLASVLRVVFLMAKPVIGVALIAGATPGSAGLPELAVPPAAVPHALVSAIHRLVQAGVIACLLVHARGEMQTAGPDRAWPAVT